MPINRNAAQFLGIEFASASYEEVASEVRRLSERTTFSYIVTPNVDHALMLNDRTPDAKVSDFRDAYASAYMRLCDSRILEKLARLHGIKLEVVTGSDLTAYLLENGHLARKRIAIVGGDEDMLPALKTRFPNIDYVQHCPPMGVLRNEAAIEAIVSFLQTEKADVIFFAIGAPQSEIIALRCLQAEKTRGVALCIGASIEFILGRKRRAPMWVRRLSLEWAFRLLSEPRRLWRRYLVDGPRIFLLAARWKQS